jgi:hypothetical protein
MCDPSVRRCIMPRSLHLPLEGAEFEFAEVFETLLEHLNPDEVDRMPPEFVAAWVKSGAFAKRVQSVKEALGRGEMDGSPHAVTFALKLPRYTYQSFIESLFALELDVTDDN